MSVQEVVAKFENERAGIEEKISGLQKRAEILDMMLAELRGASAPRRGRPLGSTKKTGKKTEKKVRTRTTGKSKRAPKKRSGVTVRDAILQVVGASKEPLPAKDILPAAVRLSSGAEASVRTQLNTLTKEGLLKQVPYEGRGFRYQATRAGAQSGS